MSVQHHGDMDGFVRSIVRLTTFAQYLRYAGYAAAVMWAVVLISNLWAGSEQADIAAGFPGSQDMPDIVFVFYVAQSTYGYLLTSVLAFGLSGLLEAKLAEELGDDDGDGDEGDDPAGLEGTGPPPARTVER
jgi:hypothetical protein